MNPLDIMEYVPVGIPVQLRGLRVLRVNLKILGSNQIAERERANLSEGLNHENSL
jgi:hypothetical protein